MCFNSGIIIESVEPTMIKSFDDNEILAQDQKSILKSSIPPSSSNMFGDRYSKHLPAKAAVKLSVGAGRRRANRNTPAEIQDQTIANRTPERGMAHTLGSDYIDPAYRVKLMECIYYGWPMMISESMDVCSPAAAPTLSRSVVLKWVYIHSKVDNWSIKRQGILILSSIVCGWSGVSREDLVMAIKFVTESYATNSAHNQVREAALFCLRRIIENSTELSIQNCLKQELGHDIRLLLVQAQSDSAPGVLDELQRIRSIWKISS